MHSGKRNKSLTAYALIASMVLGLLFADPASLHVWAKQNLTDVSGNNPDFAQDISGNDPEKQADIFMQYEGECPTGGLFPFEEVMAPEDNLPDTYYIVPPIVEEDSDMPEEIDYGILLADEAHFFSAQELQEAAPLSFDLSSYSTKYVYNRLNDREKQFWDALDAMCQSTVLNSVENLQTDSYYTSYYVTDTVYTDCFTSTTDLFSFARKFRFCNPQYYFLCNSVVGRRSGDELGVCFRVYQDLAKGTVRKEKTQGFVDKVGLYLTQVNAKGTDIAKVKEAHDLILKGVEYHHGSQSATFNEQLAYTQSAYSALMMDKTLCAGYSQAFEILCNAAGIPCTVVTSATHEWNIVNLDDNWYNMDLTWDEKNYDSDYIFSYGEERYSAPCMYRYFAKSDQYIDDADKGASHDINAYWEGYRPRCGRSLEEENTKGLPGDIRDENGNPYSDAFFEAFAERALYQKVGALPETEAAVIKPAIVVSPYGAAYLSTNTGGADIYYTITHAGEPAKPVSEAEVSSSLYKEKIGVLIGDTVRAVAVKDGYHKSEVLSFAVTARGTYEGMTEEEASTILSSVDTYGITYLPNGGIGNMSGQAGIVVGERATLAKCTFSRTGYTFTKWNTTPAGKGTFYQDEETVTITDAGTTALKLYAQWKQNQYTVECKGNGGSRMVGGAAQDTFVLPGYALYGKTYSLEKLDITANPFTRKGYLLTGWNTKPDGSGKSVSLGGTFTNLTGEEGARVVLYAQWKRLSYSISYVLAGGKNASGNKTSYTVEDAFTLKAPTRTAYAFTGWYTDSAKTKRISGITKGQTGNKTLYAGWKPIAYTITYKLDGGKNAAVNPKTYTIKSAKISLKKPSKTGYQFLGWYSNKACTKKKSTIAAGSKGNKTFYAKWKVNKYKVKFLDAQGNVLTVLSDLKYNKRYRAPKDALYKEGYTFVGWNTKKDGSGTTIKKGAYFKKLTSKNKKTVKLYPKWKKKK